MDSSTENTVVAVGSPSPATSSCSPGSAQSSMAPPATTPQVSGHPTSHIGQCVYVLSPWRRGPSVFAGTQLPAPNNPAFRAPHPTPVGLLRLAPYRPYYPSGSQLTPGAGVHREVPQDYRYNYFNAYMGAGEYDAYTAGQEVRQTQESTAQGNYESLYSNAYHSQGPMYPYSQQPFWGHTAFYGEPSDKSRLPYYPERGVHPEYIPPDGSNGSGNITQKSVRVKFMGPEATYMTTKTLMQPSCTDDINAPEDNIHVYENLQSATSDGTLGPNEVVIQTRTDGQDYDKERVTFSSIEEALALIDPVSMATEDMTPKPAPALPDNYLEVSSVAYQGLRMADEKQEEIIKAAKSLFSKRTRTLYHWLYPQTSKNKLKATVSAAWDTLHENEKQFYVSQVLGRFGLQASSLMINPQLGGIRGLPTEMLASSTADRPRPVPPPETIKLASAIETQQAVDQLFASCEDSESWTSYYRSTPANSATSTRTLSPTLTAAALSPPVHGPGAHSTRLTKSRGCPGTSHGQTNNKRKRSYSRPPETGGQARLGPVNDHLDEEVNILKRMRESKLGTEFEDDAELTQEMEKFHVMPQDSDRNTNCRDSDDFWRRTPDPEDLFTHLEF